MAILCYGNDSCHGDVVLVAMVVVVVEILNVVVNTVVSV